MLNGTSATPIIFMKSFSDVLKIEVFSSQNFQRW